MKHWIALALFYACAAHGQPCRVLDPELQGTYSGQCVNGLAEGEGVAAGSAEYRGGFQAGRKHGRGVKSWPNGDRYEGEFAADQKEGYGSYRWGKGPWEGERYDGSFVADRRQGHGTYWWPSGDVYDGPWDGDRPTGPGTDMMRARARHAAEALAAVARQGQKVCREMPAPGDGRGPAAGGARDWVRGVVVGIEGEHVGVRIDDPGVHAHFPRGETVWDLARAWTPCW